MSIIQTIKAALVNQFAGAVTIPEIVLSLIVSCVIGVFILFVYRKTFAGVVYNRGICLTIILLAMVTAMVIRTINSNLALSLGMVGALSIVRFRTVVKEPVDTAFMFWAIVGGIMSGVGLYFVAIIGSAALGALYYLIYHYGAKAKSQYLLVINCESQVAPQVEALFNPIKKKKLRSKSTNSKGLSEFTYEVEYSTETKSAMDKVQKLEGVRAVNLITYQNEFGV